MTAVADPAGLFLTGVIDIPQSTVTACCAHLAMRRAWYRLRQSVEILASLAQWKRRCNDRTINTASVARIEEGVRVTESLNYHVRGMDARLQAVSVAW